MVDQTNYLDFRILYFNDLIGDVWLGILVGILLVVLWSLKNKMPLEVTIMFILLFLFIVFAEFTQLIIIWTLVGLFIGGLFYYVIKKMIER